jgi:hypothetical protein
MLRLIIGFLTATRVKHGLLDPEDVIDTYNETLSNASVEVRRDWSHKVYLQLAVLDGRAIDEGVAVEIGYAYGKNIPCFGLQTDPRRLLPVGNNPMIANVLEEVFQNEKSLLSWAASGDVSRRTSTDIPNEGMVSCN